MLKFQPEEESSEDDDMAYLTNRFQKIVRKNKGIRKRGNFPRAATANNTCHMCEKDGHFMRDCPVLKAENKEDQRSRAETDKRRDRYLTKMIGRLQLIM